MRKTDRGRSIKKTLFFVLLTAVVFMSSCSSHLTVVIAPDYETYLKGENVLSALDKTFSFSRGRFMDKRKDTSYVGFYSTGYSATVTLVNTEQAAEDILFDGLKNVFTRSGHKWTDPPEADILVDIILQEMAAGEGGIEGAKYLTAKLDAQISFVDSATERVFYTSSYAGSSASPYDMTQRLQMAIISCMDNVGNDLKLARAIINQFKTIYKPI